MRTMGTQAIGIRTPIIREGDNLPELVADSLLAYCAEDNTALRDGDIVGITEAVVARAQGNYATVEQVADALRKVIPSGPVGIVYPILSRNRFAVQLKALAQGADKIIVQLSYPSDEFGNHLITAERMFEAGINPYEQTFTEDEFRNIFGDCRHIFTGIDYLQLYRNICAEVGCDVEIILSNNPCEILKYTSNVITADVHTRHMTKYRLTEGGAHTVIGLDDLMTDGAHGGGYNPEYGLLGSNKASDGRLKLFPRECDQFVADVQSLLFQRTGAKVEVLVYGDGAIKDPVGKIWELADPVVSPAYTSGLKGLPNEIKLKNIADSEFADKTGEEARVAMVERIRAKNNNLMGKDDSAGTTPRKLTDLVGSLCDLISGSGDKGTPVVLVRGYFDNYATE